ncbi:MAG: hypothetical protein AB7Q29_09840 [Vicinamibacterales bacterium]
MPREKPSVITPRALWWWLVAVLAAVMLRIWHLILMKQALSPPWKLGIWIVAAWCVAGAILAVERKDQRSPVATSPRHFSRRAGTFWATLALFSCLLLLFNIGYQRAASDGRGYFVQARSMVIDHDLDIAREIASFGARPGDAAFPIGTAILWSPFLLAAHLWLGLLNLLGGAWPRDGFFNPYQRAVGLGSFVYGFLAVNWIARSLRRSFDAAAATIAVAAVVLATPVVWYLAVEASMSHGAALFAVSAFLFVWLESRNRRSRTQWIVLTLLAALVTSVRPQDALVLVVLAVEATQQAWQTWRRERSATRVLRATATSAVPIIAAAAVIGLMLLPARAPVVDELHGGAAHSAGAAAPPDTADTASATSYLARQRLVSDWRIRDQLFSPHHGLISSSPVLAFAVLGLLALMRRDRLLGVSFLAVVTLQVFAGGMSLGWNAGASFGARRFVDLAMPFAFGTAAAVDVARRRPLLPVCALLFGFAATNLILVDAARRGAMTLSEPVPFRRVAEVVGSRVGNPFGFPAALWVAWRHRVPLSFYDTMPAAEFRRIHVDIGGGADDGYLTGSWLQPETDGRRTFRWAANPEAVMVVRVRAGSYRVSFVAEPFVWPDAPPQMVDVLVGNAVVATLPLPGGLSQQEVEIPDRLTPADGILRVGFRFAYARSPRELGLSNDNRRLAARFVAIDVLPR